MTKRARLRYFDSNNNSIVIGSINESGTSGIDQLTLRNSGRQFTKATVVGGKELFEKFPTKSSEVTPQNNASGPEIFLEVFNQSTGQFEVRDRLYAENQGVVTDGGRFKHKRLYGFEKFVGRQKIEISEANAVTSDIEQVLKDALPTGYSVQAEAPSGGSIPSVNNYTINGRLNDVFQDLQENYNYFVFFTGETDGSGNYIVRLEPRGFGGQVDTFEKGVDPVFFDKWTKGDELRTVTEAQVIGTDGSGNTIKETASTSPNNGRFKRKNVGYVTDSAEAKDIAVNLIAADSDGGTPESTEHGKITAPLDEPATSNLNKSVQVINNEINVDDLFTVVEQRDFFHQSQTQYSFEFEKELTVREQQDKKDLGNRNAELITEEQTDVGQQSFTGDTGSAPSDTQRDPDTGLDGDIQGENVTSAQVVVKDDQTSSSVTASAEAPASPAADGSQPGGTFAAFEGISINISYTNYGGGTVDIDYLVENITQSTVLTVGSETINNKQSINIQDFYDSASVDEGDVIEVFIDATSTLVQIESDPDEAFFTNIFIELSSRTQHLIGDDIDTEDFDHGGPSDPTQHGTSGSTDSKNVQTGTEEKVNR